jgi:hypothetical protein
MKRWWKQKSGPAKILLILATLLVAQLILVVATPSLSQQWDTAHHVPAGEGWGTFGLLVGQLSLCFYNVVAMLLTCIWWLIASLIRRNRAEKINDR